MQTIEDTSSDLDGLKWFNWLYLQVTQAVETRVSAGGFTDPCDAVYGLHNHPGLAIGQFATSPGVRFASGAFFDITITGKGAHGARPQQGIDPAKDPIVMTKIQNLNQVSPKASRMLPKYSRIWAIAILSPQLRQNRIPR